MYSSLTRSFLNASKHAKSVQTVAQIHRLPDLAFDYNAFEPIIDSETMMLHHQMHHRAFVENLNLAEEKFEEAKSKGDIDTMILVGQLLKFNGGGHLNHSLLWTILAPKGTSEPEGKLSDAIKRDFFSYSNMVDKLSRAAGSVEGSGWAWLGYRKELDKLEIACCQNQDPLWPIHGLIPLFGIDVWEHAYAMKYKADRTRYIKSMFQIANWRQVEKYFENAQNKPNQ